MKRIMMICMAVSALLMTGINAFAQDVPRDTPRGKTPKDSMYHRKPPVTPRDTIHKAPPTKPQPGSSGQTGTKNKPKAAEQGGNKK